MRHARNRCAPLVTGAPRRSQVRQLGNRCALGVGGSARGEGLVSPAVAVKTARDGTISGDGGGRGPTRCDRRLMLTSEQFPLVSTWGRLGARCARAKSGEVEALRTR